MNRSHFRGRVRPAVLLVPLLVGSLVALAAAAGAVGALRVQVARSTSYGFQSIMDPEDPTFDQLLGINDNGLIAGYYGSGASAAHPNKGFTLPLPHNGNFVSENYPGSVQTQVTAVTSGGNTAGFWVDAQGNNHGFVDWNGVFQSVDDPLAGGKTKTTQLLGMNTSGVAVGFYNDAAGTSHAFKYNQATRKFTPLNPTGASSATATGINNKDEIVGFLTRGKTTAGFLVSHATYNEFDYPGSTNTQPFGLNNSDEVVGSYADAAGTSHGFVLTSPTSHASFTTVDDPQGVGGTIVNGVNDKGQLVGFYMDASKNTVGFLATPS